MFTVYRHDQTATINNTTNQWFKLFLIDKIKFHDKIVKVLVAGVDMWLLNNMQKGMQKMLMYLMKKIRVILYGITKNNND